MKKKSLNKRIDHSFFCRDVLKVAPDLVGKILVRRYSDGSEKRWLITETEAYRGEEDLACHASKGRTPRTEVMYHPGGKVYVYLIYGMYWMLNFVTGNEDDPQAVLIRAVEGHTGPGRVTKNIRIDKSFYGEDLSASDRIWVEDNGLKAKYRTDVRVGIDYAGPVWKNKKWRFILEQK